MYSFVNKTILEKKKIAFILPSLDAGGAERVVVTLANNLVQHFEVTIITLYKCVPFYKLEKNINLDYCIENYNPKPTALSSITNHYKLFNCLRTKIKSHKIELVISFMTTANIYASVLTKLTKTPSIISERVHPKYSDISNKWSYIRRKVYPYASKLVIQTDDIRTYFKAFVPQKQLEIIRNPLSDDLIEKKDGSTLKENIILNIGRLDYQKNQDLLIKAFSEIDFNPWKLVLIGDGNLKDEYKALVEQLNLQDHVEFTGNISDVSIYLNRASIFVFTSRFEGYPNALTEAMYYGLPCISTDCTSGPSELITNNENGFLFSVGDKKTLKEKLVQLMNDSNKRKELSENAMESTKNLNSSIIVEQWKNLINEVLN